LKLIYNCKTQKEKQKIKNINTPSIKAINLEIISAFLIQKTTKDFQHESRKSRKELFEIEVLIVELKIVVVEVLIDVDEVLIVEVLKVEVEVLIVELLIDVVEVLIVVVVVEVLIVEDEAFVLVVEALIFVATLFQLKDQNLIVLPLPLKNIPYFNLSIHSIQPS